MRFLGRASSASPVSFPSHIPLRNAASILKAHIKKTNRPTRKSDCIDRMENALADRRGNPTIT